MSDRYMDQQYRAALVQWFGMAKACKNWDKHPLYKEVQMYLADDWPNKKEAKRLFDETMKFGGTKKVYNTKHHKYSPGGVILG